MCMGLGRSVSTGLAVLLSATGLAACTAGGQSGATQPEGAQSDRGSVGATDDRDITTLFERAQTSEDVPDIVDADIDVSTSRFIGESSGTRFYIARSQADDAVLCLVVDRGLSDDSPVSGEAAQDSVIPWAAACGEDGDFSLIMDDSQYTLHTDPFWEPQSGGDLVGGYVEVVDDVGE
jgi:hypothetical protein